MNERTLSGRRPGACRAAAAPLLLAASLALGACAIAQSAYSLRDIQPSPPSLMIAQRAPRVAYLVVDEGKVPDEMPVLVAGEDRGGRLTAMREFVRRDLRKALGTFFSRVEIVPGAQAIPAGPHVVVDVKLDRVEVVVTNTRTQGPGTYNGPVTVTQNRGVAVLTWGLALRPSEAGEYLYSFAGQSAGVPDERPEFVFRSMLESAISDMLKGYVDKKVHDKLLSLPPAPPASSQTTGI